MGRHPLKPVSNRPPCPLCGIRGCSKGCLGYPELDDLDADLDGFDALARFQGDPLTPTSAKRRAASAAWYAARTGEIDVAPACQRCGAVSELDGHHPDYALPLVVVWLCRRCHRRLHPGGRV